MCEYVYKYNTNILPHFMVLLQTFASVTSQPYPLIFRAREILAEVEKLYGGPHELCLLMLSPTYNPFPLSVGRTCDLLLTNG